LRLFLLYLISILSFLQFPGFPTPRRRGKMWMAELFIFNKIWIGSFRKIKLYSRNLKKKTIYQLSILNIEKCYVISST